MAATMDAKSKMVQSTLIHTAGTSQASLLDQLPPMLASPSCSDLSAKGSIKLTRPKLKVEERRSKLLKKILKPKVPLSKPYFTAGKRINDANRRNLKIEPSPFSYPGDMEEFAQKVLTKAWRDDIRVKELQLKCFQRPSYKDRQKRDLLNRLYIKEENTEGIVQTVLDVDPHYFSIIEGRPIADKIKIGDYIELVRASLRTKIMTGYREDDIMLIEENLLLEQKMIDTIKENYNTYVNTFEEFLYKDHTTAMDQLQKAEEATRKTYEMWEQYKLMAKKYGALRSSLFNLEEKWRNCKTYQKFLYTVSPMQWRVEHKAFSRASVYFADEDDDDENIFGTYRKSLLDKGVSLTDILEQFREEIDDYEPPKLYFTEPEQLMDVFRFMEMQNLNSLLHSEELAIPLDNVREGMRNAEEMFDGEIKNLQEMIDKLEGGIEWEEQRVMYLEEVALKLIDGEFKQLVQDDEVLNLHVFVEDVYETRIGPNDANLSIVDMMRGIEEKYRNELLFLDKIPSDQVAQLEGSFYAEQLMVMRLAEKAAKQYAELERLTNSLNKAFAPPYDKPIGKDLKKRSPPIKPPKKVELPPRSLTDAEAEYLEFFTDFCKYTDDPKIYGIDTEPHEEENRERGNTLESRDEIKQDDGRKLLTIASEIEFAHAIVKKRN